MAKENKSAGKVPNLRFPEFGDEWEEKILKEVLTIGSGRDYKHLSSGEVPVFGTGGLMTYVNEYIYEGESVCIGRKGTINIYSSQKTIYCLHLVKNMKLRKLMFKILYFKSWNLA
ncbi:type I restriction modification DNA specificity protein [Mucilaginibacter oryzae]|uniref:Type I restriction modification DNA specificity protein n=1 Tax=Mucilaginibacter oryzae TaxID=468058 RepID=A0A316H6E0_9SPHI|nr:restriction endonuclease subunit S [Mucilaginibacter oryzae]PWK76564.1 type I restriction modification DNA specificity protein [Mucilaginibacter oryzae]